MLLPQKHGNGKGTSMKTETKWLLVGVTVGAAAVIITLAALLLPRRDHSVRDEEMIRVGGIAEASISHDCKWFSWPVPRRGGVSEHISWRFPSPQAEHQMPYIGPFVLEITDLHGVVYKDAGDRLALGWSTAHPGSLRVLVSFSHREMPEFVPGPGGKGFATFHGGDDVIGPSAADGRIFDGARETPTRIRITIADKYYFQWDRSEK